MCQTWKAVLDSTASIWATIEAIVVKGNILNYPEVAFALDRSKQAPLSIRIWQPRWIGIQKGPRICDHLDVSFQWLVSIASPRTQSLHMDIQVPFRALLEVRWPQVTQLSLSSNSLVSLHPSQAEWKLLWQQFPSLTTIHLDSLAPRQIEDIISSPGFPCHALRILDREVSHRVFGETVQTFLSVRQLSVSLFECVGDSPGYPRLSATSITTLTITTATVDQLLANIEFPTLSSLTIKLRPDPQPSPTPFHASQVPRLHTFAIHWMSAPFCDGYDAVFNLLRSARHARHLVMDHGYDTLSRRRSPLPIPDMCSATDLRAPTQRYSCHHHVACKHLLATLKHHQSSKLGTLELKNVRLSVQDLYAVWPKKPQLHTVIVQNLNRDHHLNVAELSLASKALNITIVNESRLGVQRASPLRQK